MTIMDRLFATLQVRGLTLEAFAKKIGVTAGAVSKWKTDLKAPPYKRMDKIAEVLEVSKEFLLTGRGEGVPLPESIPATPSKPRTVMSNIIRKPSGDRNYVDILDELKYIVEGHITGMAGRYEDDYEYHLPDNEDVSIAFSEVTDAIREDMYRMDDMEEEAKEMKNEIVELKETIRSQQETIKMLTETLHAQTKSATVDRRL